MEQTKSSPVQNIHIIIHYTVYTHTNVKYYTYYMVKIIGYIKKRSKAENEEYIFYGDGNNMYRIGSSDGHERSKKNSGEGRRTIKIK